MANQYIIDLSKNVKRGLLSKWGKGQPTQLAPIGYINNKIARTIVKDPERFELDKMNEINRENDVLAPVIKHWLGRQDSNLR